MDVYNSEDEMDWSNFFFKLQERWLTEKLLELKKEIQSKKYSKNQIKFIVYMASNDNFVYLAVKNSVEKKVCTIQYYNIGLYVKYLFKF